MKAVNFINTLFNLIHALSWQSKLFQYFKFLINYNKIQMVIAGSQVWSFGRGVGPQAGTGNENFHIENNKIRKFVIKNQSSNERYDVWRYVALTTMSLASPQPLVPFLMPVFYLITNIIIFDTFTLSATERLKSITFRIISVNLKYRKAHYHHRII